MVKCWVTSVQVSGRATAVILGVNVLHFDVVFVSGVGVLGRHVHRSEHSRAAVHQLCVLAHAPRGTILGALSSLHSRQARPSPGTEVLHHRGHRLPVLDSCHRRQVGCSGRYVCVLKVCTAERGLFEEELAIGDTSSSAAK